MNNDNVTKSLKSSNLGVWNNVGFKIWMLTDYALWYNDSFNFKRIIIKNPVDDSVRGYFKQK